MADTIGGVTFSNGCSVDAGAPEGELTEHRLPGYNGAVFTDMGIYSQSLKAIGTETFADVATAAAWLASLYALLHTSVTISCPTHSGTAVLERIDTRGAQKINSPAVLVEVDLYFKVSV